MRKGAGPKHLHLMHCWEYKMLATRVLLCLIFLHYVTADDILVAPSRVDLSAGFNLSVVEVLLSHNISTLGTNLETAVIGIPVVSDYAQGYFFSVLSSEGFSDSFNKSRWGFSLGFLFIYSSDAFSQYSDIYLSVCGGKVGVNTSTLSVTEAAGSGSFLGKADNQRRMPPVNLSADGVAVPVWVANANHPLRSVNASLVVVVAKEGTRQLQLRDYDGSVVWNVSNVGMMEMQAETGTLLMYDSTNATTAVWRSSTNTLFQGQMLKVGMELISIDSSYRIRMEEGRGLVSYLEKDVFIAPYSFFYLPNATAAYLYANATDNVVELRLLSGSTNTITIAWSDKFPSFGYSFLTLDTADGGLSIHAAVTNFSSWWETWPHLVPYWGACDAPMTCGPLTVCLPGTDPSDSCECPAVSPDQVPQIIPINYTNVSQGCKRVHPLPQCNSSDHTHLGGVSDISTTFLELNQTASIFLFSWWNFSNTPVLPLEDCKKACISNCRCSGIFHVAHNWACLQMTDEIRLMSVPNQKNSSGFNSFYPHEIYGRDYTAYLKITNSSSTAIPDVTSTGNWLKSSRGALIAFATATSLVVLATAAVCSLVIVRRIRNQYSFQVPPQEQEEEEEELRDILPTMPSRFSYKELHEATQGFRKLLGAGGCGSVYAGVLPDGRKVAVKMLELLKKGQTKQFLAEVATIGRTSHHNIVRLIGFCWENWNRLLVYEFMERGSLDQWLFKASGAIDPGTGGCTHIELLLDWQTRYNVVLGIARGLNYLHEECPQPILHFDIKPQNILLDEAFVAKLADFGMSRLMQRDISQVVTGVRGTPGYIAPEWLLHGAVSKKSDVYSMGMVMLEIVAGRKNIDLTLLDRDDLQEDQWHFPTWAARKCKQGLMMELIDKHLQSAFDEKQAERLIKAAFWCIQEDPTLRPSASMVMKWLEGNCPVKQPPFASGYAGGSPAKPSTSDAESFVKPRTSVTVPEN